MQRKIDLIKAIKIFLTVAEHNSFSRASGQLNLATSAVSKNVSDLERYYGCKLLLRNTRTMHLTSDGERLVVEFKQILQQLEQLKTDVLTRKNTVQGELIISCPEHAQGLGLNTLVSDFIKAYPNVKVTMLQQNRQAKLIDEGVDLAVRVGQLEDSSLMAIEWDCVDNLFVATPEFLKRHGTPTHPSELIHFPCIREISNKHSNRWRYRENGEEKRLRIDGRVQLDKGEVVAYFAAAGHGIANLPSFMVKTHLASGTLQPILTEYQTEPLPVSLLYSQKRQQKPVLNAFIEFISQQSR